MQGYSNRIRERGKPQALCLMGRWRGAEGSETERKKGGEEPISETDKERGTYT